MVGKTNLSACAHMTNKKFTCIAVTSHNFVSSKIHKKKDCFGKSCLIFGDNLLAFLKL